MGMVDHAKEELKYLRGDHAKLDEMQDAIDKDILEIIKTFAKQGHSGGSAAYCIPIITALLRQENITPLTGKEDEWTEVSQGVYQNKRYSSIFKQLDRFNGQAYTIEGKVFSNDDGKTWYTNGDSFVPITFPYIPKEPERIILDNKLIN